MKERRRINVSVDVDTYRKLNELVRELQMKNCCQLLVAMAHVLLDARKPGNQRTIVISEDDGEYIRGMFRTLGAGHRQPDGTVPIRHNRRNIERLRWQKTKNTKD